MRASSRLKKHKRASTDWLPAPPLCPAAALAALALSCTAVGLAFLLAWQYTRPFYSARPFPWPYAFFQPSESLKPDFTFYAVGFRHHAGRCSLWPSTLQSGMHCLPPSLLAACLPIVARAASMANVPSRTGLAISEPMRLTDPHDRADVRPDLQRILCSIA